jgi:hypothetical protein
MSVSACAGSVPQAESPPGGTQQRVRFQHLSRAWLLVMAITPMRGSRVQHTVMHAAPGKREEVTRVPTLLTHLTHNRIIFHIIHMFKYAQQALLHPPCYTMETVQCTAITERERWTRRCSAAAGIW